MDESLSDSTSGQGGAIVLLESRLLIQYIIFDSHYASTSGGVIQALKSNITVLGTIVSSIIRVQ